MIVYYLIFSLRIKKRDLEEARETYQGALR